MPRDSVEIAAETTAIDIAVVLALVVFAFYVIPVWIKPMANARREVPIGDDHQASRRLSVAQLSGLVLLACLAAVGAAFIGGYAVGLFWFLAVFVISVLWLRGWRLP
jgi:hypothetical protein